MMLAMRNAAQEYAFDGFSRTSYRGRWITKRGMICWTRVVKMDVSMKAENMTF